MIGARKQLEDMRDASVGISQSTGINYDSLFSGEDVYLSGDAYGKYGDDSSGDGGRDVRNMRDLFEDLRDKIKKEDNYN